MPKKVLRSKACPRCQRTNSASNNVSHRRFTLARCQRTNSTSINVLHRRSTLEDLPEMSKDSTFWSMFKCQRTVTLCGQCLNRMSALEGLPEMSKNSNSNINLTYKTCNFYLTLLTFINCN